MRAQVNLKMARRLLTVEHMFYIMRLPCGGSYTSHGDKNDGRTGHWIYETQSEWTRETGLSRYRQLSVRRHLRELDVLEERLGGIPARLYYRLDLRALDALVVGAAPPEQDAATPQTCTRQDPDPDRETVPAPAGGDATGQSPPSPPTITENTAKITSLETACPGPYDPAEVWRSVCDDLQHALLPGTFQAWIQPCALMVLEQHDGRLRALVETPSDYERDWLTHRMGAVLPRALREVLGRPVDVVYCLPGEDLSSSGAPLPAASCSSPVPRSPNVSRSPPPHAPRKRAPPSRGRPAKRG